METLDICAAKSQLSAIVAAAERGRPTVITKDGHPSAMVVPLDAGRGLFPENTAGLADHLLAMPEPLKRDRDVGCSSSPGECSTARAPRSNATHRVPSWRQPFDPVQLPAGVTLSQAVLDERGESEST